MAESVEGYIRGHLDDGIEAEAAGAMRTRSFPIGIRLYQGRCNTDCDPIMAAESVAIPFLLSQR